MKIFLRNYQTMFSDTKQLDWLWLEVSRWIWLVEICFSDLSIKSKCCRCLPTTAGENIRNTVWVVKTNSDSKLQRFEHWKNIIGRCARSFLTVSTFGTDLTRPTPSRAWLHPSCCALFPIECTPNKPRKISYRNTSLSKLHNSYQALPEDYHDWPLNQVLQTVTCSNFTQDVTSPTQSPGPSTYISVSHLGRWNRQQRGEWSPPVK